MIIYPLAVFEAVANTFDTYHHRILAIVVVVIDLCTESHTQAYVAFLCLRIKIYVHVHIMSEAVTHLCQYTGVMVSHLLHSTLVHGYCWLLE